MMTKKVRLTITGVQTGFGQEDVSEVITVADYYEKGRKRFLFYSEYTEDHQIIKNRLTMDPDYVELKKTGNGSSLLTFRQGRLEHCWYQSPVGPMELTSDTRLIDLKISEDNLSLHLVYSLIMNGTLMSDYKLTVKAESLMQA